MCAIKTWMERNCIQCFYNLSVYLNFNKVNVCVAFHLHGSVTVQAYVPINCDRDHNAIWLSSAVRMLTFAGRDECSKWGREAGSYTEGQSRTAMTRRIIYLLELSHTIYCVQLTTSSQIFTSVCWNCDVFTHNTPSLLPLTDVFSFLLVTFRADDPNYSIDAFLDECIPAPASAPALFPTDFTWLKISFSLLALASRFPFVVRSIHCR